MVDFPLQMYSTVCRAATLLQTRYTAPAFWLTGLRLFEEVEKLVTDSNEKENMRKYIARAQEHLNEMDTEVPLVDTRRNGIISIPNNFIYFFCWLSLS